MNTEKVIISKVYLEKIQNLNREKISINKNKIKAFGAIDIDDHGYVYFPDFSFSPITHEDGMVYGMVNIGQNFRKILNEMPIYTSG